MRKTRNEILALGMKPKEGKTMYKIINGTNMLLFTAAIHDMCRNKEINEVEFTEDGELTMADGTAMKTWKVSSFTDSERVKLQDEFEVVDLKLKLKKLMKEQEA